MSGLLGRPGQSRLLRKKTIDLTLLHSVRSTWKSEARSSLDTARCGADGDGGAGRGSILIGGRL